MRMAHVLLLVLICSAALARLNLRPNSQVVPSEVEWDGPTSRPATESVYLQALGVPEELWCLDGQDEPRVLPAGVVGDPSHCLHGNARWFLTTREVPGELYPDGTVRRELFCVREDGRAVQLTEDPRLEPGPYVPRWPIHGEDRLVSWIARKWSDDGRILAGGIYSAAVRFDARGMVAGLDAAPACVAAMDLVNDAGHDWSRLPVPDVCGYDWAPDGHAVVVETLLQRLWIVELPSGLRRRLVDEPASDPAWSPCGTLIAFKRMESYGAIVTVRPDGSAVQAAAAGRPQECVVCRPFFSPNGDQLAYVRFRARYEPQVTWSECARTSVASAQTGCSGTRYTLDAPEGLIAVAWRKGQSRSRGEEHQYASRN